MKERICNVIKYLLTQNNAVTIGQLSGITQTSDKTIREDLKKISVLFTQFELELVRKPGIGTYVCGSDRNKTRLLNEMKCTKEVITEYSIAERRWYIISRLLMSHFPILIQKFEEELYVSRPSIYSDLEWIRSWFQKKEIRLLSIKGTGITLETGEKRRRGAIFEFLETCGNCVLAENNPIYSFLDTNSLKYIKSILKLYEQEFHQIFTANGMDQLALKIHIAIKRILTGQHASIYEKTRQELEKMNQYQYLCKLLKKLEDRFLVALSKEERAYILGLILGTRTHYMQGDSLEESDQDARCRVIACEIIANTKKKYAICQEDEFYRGLMHHLRAVEQKIKYGIDFYAVYLEELETKFPEIMTIANQTKALFHDFYHFEIPREEIGFIALHIASAIERSKEPLNACVIYSYNYSEAKLLANMIHNRYKQISINRILPATEYSLELFDSFDLILALNCCQSEEQENLVLLPGIFFDVYGSSFEAGINEIYEKANSKRLIKIQED